MRRNAYCAIIVLLVVFVILDYGLASSATIDGRPILSKVIGNDTLEYVGGEILVKIKADLNSADVRDFLDANGAYTLRGFDKRTRWGLVGCDVGADIFEKIRTLKSSPLIEWAEPNVIIYVGLTPNDVYYDTLQWSLNNTGDPFQIWDSIYQGTPDADIDAPEAWDIETGHAGLIIAILDSGIPLDDSGKLCHPDLNDTVKYDLDIAWDCTAGPVGARCVPAESSSVKDLYGHGTHVTGILSAMTNNATGIAGTIWDCKIMVIRLCQAAPYMTGDMVYEGIRKAYQNGAKIINLSAGAPWGYEDSTWYLMDMEDAVAEAEFAGCLIVTITGNEGPNSFRFPGGFASWGRREGRESGYANVIAAGATDYDDSLAWFSSYCDTLDVTVIAPGEPVFSTLPNYSYTMHIFTGTYTYGWGSGTSMSAPHVAGVAGLIKSRYSWLNPYEIRTRIEKTADDVCEPGWDKRSGYGRLNAWRALGLYGEIASDTTWNGSVWVSGDILIPSGKTLTVNSGTAVKFIPGDALKGGADTDRCEIIVNGGTLKVNGLENDRTIFTSGESRDSPELWHGIRVTSGSAKIEYADIKYAYCGVEYANSASDTVTHCRFFNSGTYAVKAENSNLLISDNLVEDSSSSDTTIYGIYSYEASPTIEDNNIKDCKYGIYVHKGAPTVKSNKVQRGQVGLYCYFTNSMTAKRNCFTGGFSDCYIKNHYSALNLDSCYMEGDAESLTPTGVRYQGGASGWIRHCGIFNYEDYGLYAGRDCPANLGDGYNQIYSFVDGNLTTAVKNYTKFPNGPFLEAEHNWWGTDEPGDSLFEGPVMWVLYLTSAPSIYDACTGFGGPPKIASATPVAEKFSLSQNYPNPFNPSTVIQFTVNSSRLTENRPVHTTLCIYNILGQKVKTLLNEPEYPGTYEVFWNGKDEKGQSLASGIYFYRLKTQDYVEVKKMLLLK